MSCAGTVQAGSLGISKATMLRNCDEQDIEQVDGGNGYGEAMACYKLGYCVLLGDRAASYKQIRHSR